MKLFRCSSDDSVDIVIVADEHDEGDDDGESTDDGGCFHESYDTPSDCAHCDTGMGCDWKSLNRETSRETSREMLKNHKNTSSSLNLEILVFGYVCDLTTPAGSLCRAF